MNLLEKDQLYIWHPFTQSGIEDISIPITSGEGAILFDEEGNKYIDAISSWWVNLHGHAHPYIADKINQQLRTLEHVIFAGFTHAPAILLAERLLQHTPKNQVKVFYSDNGSTSIEVGIKMALQYYYNIGDPRTCVVALKNSYHGDTFGAMSVGARDSFNVAFEPLLFNVQFIDAPTKDLAEQSLLQLKMIAKKYKIAAFIYEPLLQGSGGMLMHDIEGLHQLIKICKEENIICVADEVLTGFGRTGKFFASENMSTAPDIMCLSKGLTGGTMALGVTTCTKEIFDAFVSQDKSKTFYHGHSYTANPLACTAGLASLDLLEKEECWMQIKAIENMHLNFATRLSQYKNVEQVRILGTIIAFDLRTDERSGYFNSISTYLKREFLKKQIILRPLGNTVYILPPYCITQLQLEKVYDTIIEVIKEL